MNNSFIPQEHLMNKIIFIRGKKVMMDSDLAELYGVETKQLKRAVRRNIERFPEDFMFELSFEEYRILRSQFGTLEMGAHSKYKPFVFTEQGIAMLSSVINSPRAIKVNIAIMRAFVRLRELLISNEKLNRKLIEMEKKYDEQFQMVFKILRKFMEQPEPSKKEIGFKLTGKSNKDH